MFAYSVLCFCLVAFLCFLVLLVCREKSFCKKNKEFKIALIISFTLLLKFILIQDRIFLITIFFNYHNLSQSSQSLSQSFSIITIFFIIIFLITFFFEATTLCHSHSTLACQTYEGLYQLSSTATLGFFECLHIQFFNSSHMTYGTPCCTRGHSHSPREMEDFPGGGSHSGHMPLPTYLA